jgi:hypothetical protein
VTTNGCTQTGAVCSTSVVFDMKALLVVAQSGSTVDIFVVGQSTPYATLSFGAAVERSSPAAIRSRSWNLTFGQPPALSATVSIAAPISLAPAP